MCQNHNQKLYAILKNVLLVLKKQQKEANGLEEEKAQTRMIL
jgi:hypothetical protein